MRRDGNTRSSSLLVLGWFVVAALLAITGGMARAQPAAPGPVDLELGKKLYRANCAGCHKWHGNGGGGYGGDALSLRHTTLDRDQVITTIGCGRPGTGMPYHLRDAYEGDEKKCYGLGQKDLSPGMVLAANAFLRPGEIGVIADYVLARVKGRGEPGYDDCLEFFGAGSRVCNIFKSPVEGGPAAAPPGK